MASNLLRTCKDTNTYWNELEPFLTEVVVFRDKSFYIWKRKFMKKKIAEIRSISFSTRYEVKNINGFPSLNRSLKLINKRNNHSHNSETFFGVLESYFKTLKEFITDDAP